jgi:glycerol uptake facilitator protein
VKTLQLFQGEFFGTMILILLGGGVVAAVLLRRSKAEGAGWIVITAGWAFAVMSGVTTAIAFGGTGAINPVGPIAGMVTSGLPVNEGLAMIAGQFLGAFAGAVLVFLAYLPHWQETPDAGSKLAVFATGPAIRLPAANLLTEAIGTFVLVFVAEALAKVAKVAEGDGGGSQAFLIGALVWGIGLSLGGPTGYAINPARDLGPRLAHAVLPIPGKGDSDWGYAWVPVVGPIAGALVAAVLAKQLLGWVTTTVG